MLSSAPVALPDKPPECFLPPVDNRPSRFTRDLREKLLKLLEKRLTEDPYSVELQVERSLLLSEMGRSREGALSYQNAIKERKPRYPLTTRAYNIWPHFGKSEPITVILVGAPNWGNAPFLHYLDDKTFLTLQIIADYHDNKLPLPPHQLIINCISEADHCPDSLKAALAIVAQSQAPIINAPYQILATSRTGNAERFASVPGVRTPRIENFSKAFLKSANIETKLEQKGFKFPLLLRSPGYHTGFHFVKVDSQEQLQIALEGLPGDTLIAIEFLDSRHPDGFVRKYRVIQIEGKFYPAHTAISKEWKVHYFTANMAESPEHRAEDQAFLEDMPLVLGPRAMEALQKLGELMKLDYWGIDFSLGKEGEVLLYEANATMRVFRPEKNSIWDYRTQPIQKIEYAIRNLLINRAQADLKVYPSAPPEEAAFTNLAELCHIMGLKISKQEADKICQYLLATNPNHPIGRMFPAQALQEFALSQLHAKIEQEPDQVEWKVEKARLLIELNRIEEAKEIYLAILTQDPNQPVVLNNLAVLLFSQGHHKTALQLYHHLVALHPEELKARENLARALRESGEVAESRFHYDKIVQTDPDHAEAHLGLAYVEMYLGHKDVAQKHYQKATERLSSYEIPGRKSQECHQIPILVLVSPCGGNSPLLQFLEYPIFARTPIVPEFYDPARPLPPHHLVINVIGDADHCSISLAATDLLVQKSQAPVLNLPARIRLTGRVDNARTLGTLEGVVAPKTVPLSREILLSREALRALSQHDISFPLLLRTPGFHGGDHFVRVEKPEDLAPAVAMLPGNELLALQYLDARDADGKIRKYRVMLIDGKLFPLHKAISRHWMIHYHSADMINSAENRDEEQAFLEDMPGVLGEKATEALHRIQTTLGLDYAGVDFSLGPNREIYLFEANATMIASRPGKGSVWAYRHESVRKIHEAVRNMILLKAAIKNPA